MTSSLTLPTLAALVMVSTAAQAQPAPALTPISEVELDLDGDGKMDRAALVEGADGSSDLYIYMPAGPDKLDLSRKPTVLKRDIARDFGRQIASKGRS